MDLAGGTDDPRRDGTREEAARYARLAELFERASELAPEARPAFLAAECRGDADLRAEVEALLVLDSDESSVLDRPPSSSVLEAVAWTGLEPGEVFGGYRIVRELGHGGQGYVYLAEDAELGRRVALKVLPPFLSGHARNASRFRREIEAAARLDHPGICQVHRTGVERGLPFFVMPYLVGETLAERLGRSRARPPTDADRLELVRLVEQAARAMHVAHEAGIVHRDLKPGNIIVTPGGHPVVIDLGVAHDDEQSVSLTLSGDVFGTPAYMPPEQIRGERGVDRRADVYSLGTALYEGLTRRLPFEAATRHALFQTILEKDPLDPRRLEPGVSAELAVVLETALAKEPERRYATAQDLADDLARVRRGQPIHARRPPLLRRALLWARRDPARAWTAGGLAGTLVAGILVTTWLGLEARASAEHVTRLADLRAIERLLHEAAEELWPVAPETVPRLDAWLTTAARVRSREAGYRHDALHRGEEGTGELGRILQRLERLEEVVLEVRDRREQAATLRARSIDAHAELWRATIEAIAAEPLYGGLRIEPQPGLVPLGRGRNHAVHEFAHVASGTVPVRDWRLGELELTEQTGLVFTLIPGGAFHMGGVRADDPISSEDERPVHRVELAPFFLSKYEMTQGQWLRLTGENPSRWHPGSDAHDPITLLHPVENLSWEVALETLARHALLLPTEAQWEYAAKGGRLDYRFGPEGHRRNADRFANLADQAAARAGAEWPHISIAPELDDGHVEHAPVGSFLPGAFALHDMYGNAWELVRDPFGSYGYPVRAGDGERRLPDTGIRTLRGGGYYESIRNARPTRRYKIRPDKPTYSSGVRPSLALVVGARED